MTGFAVVDFETTGLFPGGHDRVIELAVVQLSSHGQFEGQWESLVNPGRDVGRADSHRIRTSDVLDAPTFAEIAPRLLDLLRGRVVVAHNASFDVRFLVAELRRAGLDAPADIVTLCTMQLARDFLPGSGRSLTDCCAALDIELDGGHRAAGDARATARLLAAYIEAADAPEFWAAHLAAAADVPWPVASTPAVRWYARTVSSHPMSTEAFLEHLATRLPNVAGPAEYVDYLALLDRCLIDRTLSSHEADSLARLAQELGLDRATAERLNRQYFAAFTALAWTDGMLTTAELADLVNVGMLLGQPAATVAAALNETRQQPTSHVAAPAPGTDFSLQPGDLVVLTGDMLRVRSDWERELRELGLVPWSAVTKKVKLLVAADTGSLSGKARKARDYGIPIVDEATLIRLARARVAGR
ncbi:exonuclease domain-containing protein [Cryobacterium sp. SO2]|uniref:exonuclease domain-containing protein n=1 Tax=Cryobacterium sp. SO2 TaxID=1897060 RepID=UPI00223E3AFD|nr:exonuclease domain-containing protein [Cryobacterium sp. SO2]WEO76306.1 exonuclease domain-containing protein [Cryobacterium sp. SO2]